MIPISKEARNKVENILESKYPELKLVTNKNNDKISMRKGADAVLVIWDSPSFGFLIKVDVDGMLTKNIDLNIEALTTYKSLVADLEKLEEYK